MPPAPPEKVVLHPLVLLSVVDHYNRVAKDSRKRVVGVLLGEVHKGQVDVSNSFAGETLEQISSYDRSRSNLPISLCSAIRGGRP